jgi:hypothetical protein
MADSRRSITLSYPTEPKANGPGFVSPLQGCPNTLLTPHIGGSTEEAQAAIGVEVQAHALAISAQAVQSVPLQSRPLPSVCFCLLGTPLRDACGSTHMCVCPTGRQPITLRD